MLDQQFHGATVNFITHLCNRFFGFLQFFGEATVNIAMPA
jgi:hypothetical protein